MRIVNDIIKKLDKTGSTDRTSASSRPRTRTHENTKVVFSLNKAVNQWLKEFCWSFWLKEDNDEQRGLH